MSKLRSTTSVVLACALAVALGACGKKSDHAGPAPDVTGLGAVPANAEVVIGADVGKLAASPLVTRMIEQLLLGDPKLAAAWQQVREGCKIDVAKQVKRVVLAQGPVPPGGRAGTGPALLVATGNIPETDLTECIGKFVGKGGGSVTGRAVADNRTLYQVKDGARVMYFAYSRADTVVLGNNEAYVIEAIGAGTKASDHPELKAWLSLIDQNAPAWGVGRFDDRVRQGLLKVLPGLKAGITAAAGQIDPSDGLALDLVTVMSSSEDAKRLESFTNEQKTLIGMAAQWKGLGTVVNKVTIQSSQNTVRFKARLDNADLNQLLSMLDGPRAAAQDTPPTETAPK